MAKECSVCKTINHSAANHCTTCGNELPDKELTAEDQLRIELHHAKETIETLKKALNERDETIQMHKNKLSESSDEIAFKEKQFVKKQQNKEKQEIVLKPTISFKVILESKWIIILFILAVASFVLLILVIIS